MTTVQCIQERCRMRQLCGSASSLLSQMRLHIQIRYSKQKSYTYCRCFSQIGVHKILRSSLRTCVNFFKTICSGYLHIIGGLQCSKHKQLHACAELCTTTFCNMSGRSNRFSKPPPPTPELQVTPRVVGSHSRCLPARLKHR